MTSLEGFVFLAWISFGLVLVPYAVLATDYERTLIFKEPIPDKVLPGHVIRTEQVPNEGSCRVKCYLDPNCVSINVGPATEGRHECELNHHTDDSPSKIPLKKERGFTHYSVENFCLANPCRGMNALCQVGFGASGYRCACNADHTPECREALGMENRDIRNKQINASSEWISNHTAASKGRLNSNKGRRRAWSSSTNGTSQWLQIDLRSQHTIVTGVATQGRNGTNEKKQWVTRYKLQYGNDGVNFTYYRNHTTDKDKEFTGNTDPDTVVLHDLNPPIRARFIRFRPTAWHGHISMRAELYGCQDCVPGAGSLTGSNYLLFTKRETWNDARANCQRLGGDLVKIESAEENKFINDKFLTLYGLNNVTYWIGLRYQNEGDWIWTDGSLLNRTYNIWRNNNDTVINCAVIIGFNRDGNRYKWSSRNCAKRRSFICEMGRF